MRVQYQWTQSDWTEAVSLANRRSGKRESSMPGLTWALVLIPLVGAGGDLLSNVRGGRQLSPSDLVLPLLLVALAVIAAVIFTVAKRQRIYRMLQQAAMPNGECEVVLQESGWCVRQNVLAAPFTLNSWSDLREARRGNRVLVLMGTDSFEALPLSSLTSDQDGHVHRLVTRKLRPPIA